MPWWIAFWSSAAPATSAHGEEAAALPLAMLLVFASAKLLGEICERLGQPAIVGQIVAGAILGPAAFGFVLPTPALTALSELGVMFLLFQVGLEVRAAELKSVGRVATVVAVAGVVLPFLAGWGILTAAGSRPIEATFMGAAMVATSVGITAQVLQAGGYLHCRASRVILVAAVVDDVLGLIVLAVVSSVARGPINWLEIGLTAALAIGFVLLSVQFGSRAMERLVPRMRETMRSSEADFAIAISLLFGLAALAVYAGVAALVGAFLAGMMLTDSIGERAKTFVHGGSELLIPFFLFGIGMNVNLAVFAEGRTAALALVILLAAVLSKLLACGWGALPLGRQDALRVGAGMIPRGEVGMVVAQIGLGMGVISAPIYAVTVFMAVATTMIAPALLRRAFRDETPIPVEAPGPSLG
jgi:Kef-type K+ transport system membrane component KefB